VDFRQTHSTDWLDYFARIGYPAVQPLAAGVEGAVYRLAGGMIAKVWLRRGPAELRLRQARRVWAAPASSALSTMVPPSGRTLPSARWASTLVVL
jgi:hypothetical protein